MTIGYLPGGVNPTDPDSSLYSDYGISQDMIDLYHGTVGQGSGMQIVTWAQSQQGQQAMESQGVTPPAGTGTAGQGAGAGAGVDTTDTGAGWFHHPGVGEVQIGEENLPPQPTGEAYEAQPWGAEFYGLGYGDIQSLQTGLYDEIMRGVVPEIEAGMAARGMSRSTDYERALGYAGVEAMESSMKQAYPMWQEEQARRTGWEVNKQQYEADQALKSWQSEQQMWEQQTSAWGATTALKEREGERQYEDWLNYLKFQRGETLSPYGAFAPSETNYMGGGGSAVGSAAENLAQIGTQWWDYYQKRK